MYFFIFRSRPKPENEYSGKYGGAYINCWINRDGHAQAEEMAREYIDTSGWTVEAKEEERATYEEDYTHSADRLECYRKAAREGSCFVFHTYPLATHANN
jgi:hypothetical protein